MIIRVRRTTRITPRTWAAATAFDGVVYSRAPQVELPHYADYRRAIPDKGTQQSERPRRLIQVAGRLAQVGGFPIRNALGRRQHVAHHRQHLRWLEWSTSLVDHTVGYVPAVPAVFHPYKQKNPLFFRFGQPGWWSPLSGRYNRDPAVILGRRSRGMSHRDDQMDRLRSYLDWHFQGRRRPKRFTPAEIRTFRFRRKRLQKYVFRRLTHRNYLAGITRHMFSKSKTNRFHWLEKQQLLLTAPVLYYQSLAYWFSYTFKSRVNTPMEYNYDNTRRGYFRLVKRRRLTGRRWKLRQHPEWALFFKQARELRWKWFDTTFLGQQLVQSREVTELQQTEHPPLTTGLFASVYWSVQRWGRSRWRTRPTERARWVFVDSVKSGTAVEPDATQWGRTSTSSTGVLISLGLQLELRPVPPAAVWPSRWRWITRAWNSLDRLTRGRGAVPVVWLWRYVVTPVWWIYHLCGALWSGFFSVLPNLPRQFWLILTLPWFFVGEVLTELWKPVWSYIKHWVQERRLVKTLAWLYNAWLLTYTTDNDQAELEITIVDDPVADRPVLQEDDQDANEEHEHHWDQMGEGIYSGNPTFKPTASQWMHDWDSFWDDFHETWQDFFFDELPYQLGLWFRPWGDFLVRLPWWALVEGLSLLGLTLKLEYQRSWVDLLRRGNLAGRVRGRWWKIPLLGIAYLSRWVLVGLVTWGLIHQMEYSSFRIWVTYTLGLVWFEEYYVGWCLFCLLTAVGFIGPTSWKNYFFHEVGLFNWVGLWAGVAVTAEVEDYYPHTRLGTLERRLQQAAVMVGVRPEQMELAFMGVDRHYDWGYANLTGYDRARLVLDQLYDPLQPDGVDPEEVEQYGFIFPLDTEHPEPAATFPWQHDYPRWTRADLTPHEPRTNLYDIDFSSAMVIDWNQYQPNPYTETYRQDNLTYRTDTTVTQYNE